MKHIYYLDADMSDKPNYYFSINIETKEIKLYTKQYLEDIVKQHINERRSYFFFSRYQEFLNSFKEIEKKKITANGDDVSSVFEIESTKYYMEDVIFKAFTLKLKLKISKTKYKYIFITFFHLIEVLTNLINLENLSEIKTMLFQLQNLKAEDLDREIILLTLNQFQSFFSEHNLPKIYNLFSVYNRYALLYIENTNYQNNILAWKFFDWKTFPIKHKQSFYAFIKTSYRPICEKTLSDDSSNYKFFRKLFPCAKILKSRNYAFPDFSKDPEMQTFNSWEELENLLDTHIGFIEALISPKSNSNSKGLFSELNFTKYEFYTTIDIQLLRQLGFSILPRKAFLTVNTITAIAKKTVKEICLNIFSEKSQPNNSSYLRQSKEEIVAHSIYNNFLFNDLEKKDHLQYFFTKDYKLHKRSNPTTFFDISAFLMSYLRKDLFELLLTFSEIKEEEDVVFLPNNIIAINKTLSFPHRHLKNKFMSYKRSLGKYINIKSPLIKKENSYLAILEAICEQLENEKILNYLFKDSFYKYVLMVCILVSNSTKY